MSILIITFVITFYFLNMTIYHFSQLVHRQAEKYGKRTAFRHKDKSTGKWISTTWNTFSQQVKTVARSLASIGVQVQENIATYTQNKPEGIVVDFAAYANRAVVIPLYATSSQSQIEYIINEAKIRCI